MVTQKLSEAIKVRRAFGRAFAQLGRSLPAALGRNWRGLLMPWRMIPTPVALAFIALIALTVVLDNDDASTSETSSVTLAPVASVGGTNVPASLNCAEDESIAFVGVPDTLVCVHVDNFAEAVGHGCVRPAMFDGARCMLPLQYATPVPATTAPSVAPPLTGEPLACETGDRTG